MHRFPFLTATVVLFAFSAPCVGAQDILVPAGTLLKCTMNEPNFHRQRHRWAIRCCAI